MEISDFQAVVKIWNKNFIYDKVDNERFKEAVFDDPNYDKKSTLVATDNNKIIGFAGCVVREDEGENEKDVGYLKAIFAKKEYRNKGIRKLLLQHIADFLRSKKKRMINVVRYSGSHYFFPGIDIRYKDQLKFFEKRKSVV